jgi:hypothetical protein
MSRPPSTSSSTYSSAVARLALRVHRGTQGPARDVPGVPQRGRLQVVMRMITSASPVQSRSASTRTTPELTGSGSAASTRALFGSQTPGLRGHQQKADRVVTRHARTPSADVTSSHPASLPMRVLHVPPDGAVGGYHVPTRGPSRLAPTAPPYVRRYATASTLVRAVDARRHQLAVDTSVSDAFALRTTSRRPPPPDTSASARPPASARP